jgi:adsorption protein B
MTEMLLTFWQILSWMTLIFVFIFAIDDLFIDAVSILFRLGPKKLTDMELGQMHSMPQKKIAIIVANWKEHDVIERMVTGNVAQIDYVNYHFFLGVYPNDIPTWEAASRAESKFSRVSVVVNSKPGPTNKGQMLNEIVRAIKSYENTTGAVFDMVLMQDSEDLIHPMALKYINMVAENADFIQTPVFSLPLSAKQLVGGTYIDEFSESHAKDLIVRHYLGAAIPSAGVGTAISCKIINDLLKSQNGNFLKDNTLTEDYFLGVCTHLAGYRSHFSVAFRERKNGLRDYVSTREYFPQNFSASVRQKSRWTLGISIQGYKDIGWQGSAVDRYFLWRDRRGLINSALMLMAFGMLCSFLVHFMLTKRLPDFSMDPLFQTICAFNIFSMGVRLVQRVRSVALVNDLKTALLVPVRWPLANVINFLASVKAIRQYRTSTKTGEQPKWIKTDHILPEQFGLDPVSVQTSQSGS